MYISRRALHDYRGFQRWLKKLKNQNAGESLSSTFPVTVGDKPNQLVIRVGHLLSLLLEYQDGHVEKQKYQEIIVEEQKYQDGHVYQDMREKTRSDLFTFLCNKLEKHWLYFTLSASNMLPESLCPFVSWFKGMRTFSVRG